MTIPYQPPPEGSFQALAKAELHLHLEGAISPQTLREIAPDLEEDKVRARCRFEDFQGFLETYKWVVERLQSPEHYALALRRLLEKLIGENVRYAEITLSAGVILRRGQDLRAIFEALRRESLGRPIQVRWIFDAVRQWGPEEAWRVARAAAELAPGGVVAFSIGGDEQQAPPEMFAEVFRFARRCGLHLAAHAGETEGPASIWGALALGAERIGHGIRAIEDPLLVKHLSDRRIPLEICLSSNLATGVTPDLKSHPLRRLYEAGVAVTLNTDDPALFKTTLTREFQLAAGIGFSWEELKGIAAAAFGFAFDKAAASSQR